MEKVKDLLKSEIFRAAMDQIPASIIITNAVPEILYVNKFFTEITGYSFEEIKGENPNILNSGSQGKEFYRDMWETISAGKLWEGEFRNVSKKGSFFWEKASIIPIADDSGDLIYYMAVKQDITDNKENIEKTERRERLLNNIEQLSQTGGWEYDILNDEYFWTDELYKLFGVDKSLKNLPRNILDYYAKEDQPVIARSYQECISDGTPYDHTVRFTDAKGKRKWVRSKGQASFNDDGKVIRVFGSLRDVTDEIDTLHALKKSQKEFRTVVESFDDIVYTLDQNGKFTNLYGRWANDEALSEMILGKSVMEVLGEQQEENHRQALNIARKEGHATYEWYLKNAAGVKNYYETKLTRLKSISDNNDDGFLGVGRNITSEKYYRRELEEVKERLNYSLIGTRAGTWDWNVETGKTIFNERWAQMLGYSLEELEPTYIETWQNLVQPDDLAKANREMNRYFNGETPIYDVKLRMQHKQGHWVWVWERGAIFEEDEHGNPLRMVGTHVEISEWMEAEQRLKRSERKYRELFEGSSDPSLLMKEGHITDCNQAALDLLGYQGKENVIGKTMIDISPSIQNNGWNSEKLIDELLQGLKDTKKGIRFEWDHLKKDGTTVPVEVVMTNLTDNDGNIVYVVWRDITERKEAEEKLMDAYKERGTLLSEIHHRVKNNLAIISGLIQLQMFNTEDSTATEELSKSVNRIKSIALIHEQLYQSDSFSNISLKKNIEKQAQTLFSMYKGKEGADVTLDLDLSEVQININQALPVGLLLNEILNNSFKHAFKGMGKGEVRVKLTEQNQIVSLTISDNGVGFGSGNENRSSLGYTLIKTFSKQLHADMNLSTDNGTSYNIRFSKQDQKGTMASNMHIF